VNHVQNQVFIQEDFMRRLLPLLVLLLVILAGCSSSTGNDNNNQNTGTNTTGNGGTLKVSGMAKLNSADGAAISGATVTLVATNTNLTCTTDASGNYSFTKIAKGTYTVSIMKINVAFTPNTLPALVDSTDVVVQTFVGTTSGVSYTVSGSVRLTSASGTGIAGVTVVLASVSQPTNTKTATTASSGAFSFSNVAAGSYLVTVAKTDYTFLPEFVSVSVVDKDVTVQTFVGTAVNTSGDAGTHSLFPLKTNATWTFDSILSVGSFNISGSEIDKVTGTINKGGKTYWSITSTRYDSDGNEDSVDNFTARIENNVLYTYGTDFFTAKVIPETDKASKAAAVLKQVSTDSDLATIKFNVSAGTTWDIYRDSGSGGGLTYSFIITGKYVGTEAVGSYASCPKYELEYGFESSSTSSGKTAGKWARTLWFAPSVGIVKTVDLFSNGETLATIQLISTTTNTLRSSQIP
jgi:hypothetical protein